MALSEAWYDLDASFNLDDLTHEDLYAFERSCRQPGSAASDDSAFAYATGQPTSAPLYSAEERAEARQFLMEAFSAAGMKGEPTDTNKPLPPLNARRHFSEGDEESSVFDYGVG
jgi:hypothetical protein